jgi:hypothetical protein
LHVHIVWVWFDLVKDVMLLYLFTSFADSNFGFGLI